MNHTFYVDSTKENADTIQKLLDSCAGQETLIVFREGDYYFDKGLVLTEKHRNLTLRGEGCVRFIGGKRLTEFEKASQTPEAARLDPEVRDRVYVCDLSEAGIPAAGGFVSRGYARQVAPSHSELFLDTVPMNLSQYPKGDGFLTITGVGKEMLERDWNVKGGELESGYYYEDERPKHWAESGQIWTLGYWAYDWANSVERIRQLDADRKFIKNHPPYGNQYYKEGQRFRFYHVLEEVNRPGDYYIDYDSNMAYFYPEAMNPDTEVIISMLDEPFLVMRESSRILVENITFEMVRGHGVRCEYTTDVTFDRCCFRNIGNYALGFVQGKRNCVRNSDIHDCGDSGIVMLGGNRRTLESADGMVENNHIYRIAKWSKCYQPGISLTGVGMTARHNLIHDCPHTAIMYWGNEMTIEDNEIYSVVMETGDAGAIYTGRDYTFRGNRVNHNYLHHLGGVGIGTMAIYNDDAVSGTEMRDNFFEEVSRGAFMGGGRDFVVKNNVFVKCYPAIAFDCRGADDNPVWRRMVENTLREHFYRIQAFPLQGVLTEYERREYEKEEDKRINAMDSEYIRRYPELARIDQFYRNPVNGETRIPGSALIENNVFCSKPAFRYRFVEPEKTYYEDGKKLEHPDEHLKSYITDTTRDIRFTIGGEKGDLRWNSNYPAVPEDFVDAKWGDLALRPGSKAFSYGYVDSDFASIGLEEEKRSVNPPRVRTCVFLSGHQENTVTVGLRNQSDVPVYGTLQVYAPEDVVFAARDITFEAGPGEEREYTLEVLECGGEFEMEVRSDTAGVRPSRGIIEIPAKKETH